MLVQIYEITMPEEARALSRLGVDHVGVLVGEGAFPREVTVERAKEILAAVEAPSRASVLSLAHDLEFIGRIVAALDPPILHLGAASGLLGPEDVRALKRRFPHVAIMRSIPVVDEASVALAKAYDAVADYLLLDSYSAGDHQIGALGVTHSWELDRAIVETVRIPVVIAGGLGPENVADAIRAVRPAGVDSKTKTDKSDGSHSKDLAKVKAFVDAARSAT